MEGICIVHDRKSLSKFHGTINQLRRTNEFHYSILQQLPKRCCSCHNQTGESSFTIDDLRELCQQIQSSSKATSVNALAPPVKPIHYVILTFPATLTPIQRIYKAGRFVGRNGQHIRLLQQTLNVHINILNQKSKGDFRKIMEQVQIQNKEKHENDLYLLITMKNEDDDLEKVKQSLEKTWTGIDVTTRQKRRIIIQSSAETISPLTDISGDTRWKPKKYKQKEKHRTKENQHDEQVQIQPQPFVPLLPTRKELNKHQKSKRK